MSLARVRDWPAPDITPTDANRQVVAYLEKLYHELQQESVARLSDFDILQLANVPWVDVRDYGAVGDGSDATFAFNAANAVTSSPLFVPPGTYSITSDITCVGLYGIPGESTHIELEDSAKIIISGGTDSWHTPLKNLYIEIKDNNATGVEIRRRRVHVDGVYMLGNGKANGQKGFYFNLDQSVQTFHNFEGLQIWDLGYPFYIFMTSGKGNWFNSNRIGHLGTTFLGGFINGVTFDTGDNSIAVLNTFGGYYQTGTAAVHFKKDNFRNYFNVYLDAVTDMMTVDTGVTLTGNIYHIARHADYSVTGAGASTEDFVLSDDGFICPMIVEHEPTSTTVSQWIGQKFWGRSGYLAKTANFNIATPDSIYLCNATDGAITATLPSPAANFGIAFTVKKTDASANAVTVSQNAAETIDGAASVVLAAQYDRVTVVSDATNWHRLE